MTGDTGAAGSASAIHHVDRAGYSMVFWAAVLWSTGGFFVRLIPLDGWTLLAWRSLFGVLAILAFALWQQGMSGLQFRKLATWHGVVVVLCAGIGMICFVMSNVLTSVANVAVLYATLPFMTAGLAWAWIGERPSRRTLLASFAALAGVIVMARGSIGGGHLLGDTVAIGMTILTAILAVTVRRHRDTPILEAVIAGGLIAMFAGWLFGVPLVVQPAELGWLAIFGALTLGGGMALFTVGARRIPSAHAALLGALETPLAPLWVWLAFSEVPPTATFIGGALIMAALAWHYAGEIRQQPG